MTVRQGEGTGKPQILPGNVEEVQAGYIEGEGSVLLHPLIPLDGNGPGLLATIVYDLLGLGYAMKEIRARFNSIPREWTIKAVRAHVWAHGRTLSAPVQGRPGHKDYVQTFARNETETVTP